MRGMNSVHLRPPRVMANKSRFEALMKGIIFIAIAFFYLGSFAGCSRSKSTMQSTPARSAQVNNNQNTQPSVTQQANAIPADASPNDITKTSSDVTDELHTPEKGSPERQAIMDALRGDQKVMFQVNYLKVHNGWCWVDTTPLNKSGRATAEGGPNLLHFENERWKAMDLSKVPEDPNDPLGPEDASPTFVQNLMKKFPGVPRDIFPKPTNQ